ncbi:MAG: efflux RND transporter permease subunit [Candidatus Gracilibacteria bacterium]
MSEIIKHKNVPYFKRFKAILIFVIIFSFIVGTISFVTMPKESSPEIDLPNYTISNIYPGGDPKTIEAQIIDRLEGELSSISGLKEMKGTAGYNMGIISLEFHSSKLKEDAMSDINSAVDKVKGSFPEGVKDPIIKKVNLDDSPIFTFSIAGNYMANILYKKVKYIEDDLKKIKGISDIVVVGKVNPEIKLLVDYDKLNHYNIDYGYFINEIKKLLSKVPVDKKDINGSLFSFEVASYETDIDKVVEQIKDFNLVNIDGKIIKVSDISNVYLGIQRQDRKSFVYNTDNTTYSAISFQVKKISGADILDIIGQVKEYLDIQEKKLKSDNIKFYEILSQKEKIDNTYETFIQNFRQTSIFIFLIVVIFIGFKESLALTISFPLVYLITFIVLSIIGYTFNMIVSFSLILTLGIMVDSLIVIMEGYDDGLKRGLSKNKALIYTINTYRQPLISGTLTTIVMFLPLYFMLTGVMGEFMRTMPITIGINLIIAIIVSIVFLPVIINLLNFKKKKDTKEKKSLKKQGIHWDVTKYVYPFIKTKKRAIITVLSFWGLFVFTISLVVFGAIKVDFMSPVDSNNITVNLNYIPGIDLEKNRELTYKITTKINNYFEKVYPNTLEYIGVDLGVKSGGDPMKNAMYGTSGSDNYSTLTIKLADKDNKRIVDGSKYKAYTIKENLQKFVDKNIKSKYLKELLITSEKSGPGTGKPISFNFIGENLDDIIEYIDILYPKLENIEGSFNWGSSLEYTNGKIRIIWDYNKLKQYGVTADRLNLLLMGIKNTPNYIPNGITIDKLYDLSDEELEIKTFLDFDGNIEDLKVNGVYLSNFIKDIKFLPELKTIDHLDTRLVVEIDADQASGVPLSVITEKINEVIKNNPSDKVIFAYGSDIKEQENSGKDMGMSFLVGIFLMFGVLILQFNNFRYPLLILSSLPLLMIGAFGLLGLLGQTFSFAAQIGIFGLIGVGVNTSILLLESYSDKLERDGKFSVDLLLETINSRVKPIFLTTLTTSVGLTTLALKDEMWAGLGIAFMGGLIFGTIMVLLYIPAVLRIGSDSK